MIINDMEFFGYDLRAALQHAIETSPSDDFKDIMHSLLTVVDSGGNITSYFADKSEHYLNKAIMDQKGFLETLGLMAESYVTALVAGPLFIVIIQTVIALLSPGGDISLYAIIYIMIPAGSLMFVFVINIMTPGDVKGAPLIEIEQKYDMDIKIPEDSTEKELLEQLGESRKKLGYKHFLQHPIQPVFEKPFRALYVSGPAGLIFLLVGVFVLNRNRAFEVIDDYMIYMTFIILTPFVFFYEAKSRKEKKLKGEIPGFLHRLALTNEIGMTIPESIELMAKQETGIMTDEIRKIQRDLNWGLSVQDAFARFANRLRVGAVSRTVKLLIEALKSSGNIREVLYITSNDAKTTQVLDKERALNMLIYIVIIYMSFMVFAIVVMIMCSSFLPVMAESGAAAAKAAGGMRTGAGLQVIDLPKYKRLFFHAAVFQGFGGGLMAGQMGEGKALAGFKHSLIMVMIAFVMFRMFI
jgi:flagellar protein FlaJ